jgi:hypothetical protein
MAEPIRKPHVCKLKLICDYHGKKCKNKIFEHSIPGNKWLVLNYCADVQNEATRDIMMYCKNNKVFPIDQNEFSFIRVKRSNGDIEDNWMLEFNCIFFIESNPYVRVYNGDIYKQLDLKEFCQLNGINYDSFIERYCST